MCTASHCPSLACDVTRVAILKGAPQTPGATAVLHFTPRTSCYYPTASAVCLRETSSLADPVLYYSNFFHNNSSIQVIVHLIWRQCTLFYLFIYKLRTQCHTIIAETVQNSNRHWREWKKPCSFLNFFSKRLGIFNQFFTHLLNDPFSRLQIFIQISPTLTKLCQQPY